MPTGLVLGRLASHDRRSACAASTSRSSRRMSTAATTSSSSTPRRCGSPATRPISRCSTTTPVIAGGIKGTVAAPNRLDRAPIPERVIEKAVERMITRGPLQRAADEAPVHLQAGARASSTPGRSAAAARRGRDEPQEQEWPEHVRNRPPPPSGDRAAPARWPTWPRMRATQTVATRAGAEMHEAIRVEPKRDAFRAARTPPAGARTPSPACG